MGQEPDKNILATNTHENEDDVPIPFSNKRLLSPDDRIAEVLYGIINTLTVICTFSIIRSDKNAVDEMLYCAIGCNVAWGLVDAVMYLLTTMAHNEHSITILNVINRSKGSRASGEYIRNALPDVISSVLQTEDIEKIERKLLLLQESQTFVRLHLRDYGSAIAIFIIIILSTFPIAVPFIVIDNVQTALRTSYLVAIAMMFICGWNLGKYTGHNRFLKGLVMSLIGIGLAGIAILFGA